MNKQYEDVKEVTWEYENAEDSVEGVLISVQPDVGEFNQKLYTLEQPDKTLISVWGSTVLDRLMSRLGIVVGSDIRIVYLGEVKPDKGKEYHNFKIQKAVEETKD